MKLFWSLHRLRTKNNSVEAEPTDSASSLSKVQVWLSATTRLFFGSRLRFAITTMVVLGLWYGVHFVVPRPISFSYAGSTCTSEVILAPGVFRGESADNLQISYEDTIGIGSFDLISTKTCVNPVAAPVPGTVSLESSPFGMPMLQQRYTVRVDTLPKVMSSVDLLPVAMSKPVQLTLSQPDDVHRYYLKIENDSQRCVTQGSQLYCRVDRLNLAQGAQYAASIERSLTGKTRHAVAKVQVDILPAVHISESSVQQGQTIYTRPTAFVLKADKEIRAASVQIETVGANGETTPIPLVTKVKGTDITVELNKELPREKSYRLTVTKVEAVDGSGLASPHTVAFSTSGGPKVVGVNIGHAGVSPAARVVVTLDQPLASAQDIGQFVGVSGGDAAVTYSGSQVVLSLRGLSACTPFGLYVHKGLLGENGLVSSTDWSYDSRTSCRQATQTIGQSVQGRPIVAYYYGSGPTTVLFTGGIHGDEHSGRYMMQDWVAHLDAYGYKIPAGRRVVVVPNLSPDGAVTNSRYNVHGVNLDRNFPSSDWATDIGIRGGVKPGGGGTAPLSEPEAQAIASLTETLRPRLVMTYHSQGSLVGINKVADSAAIGNVYASMVGYRTMYDNAEAIMGYSFTGEYETWIGEKLGAPAVLIELPTDYGRYFSRHEKVLWRMVGI